MTETEPPKRPNNPETRGVIVTLRDLFAAFCMAGDVASLREENTAGPSAIAAYAYAMADAMLAEREKP